MQTEMSATIRLLSEGTRTKDQTRRVLKAIGELAQLGAWVAGDSGLLDEAAPKTPARSRARRRGRWRRQRAGILKCQVRGKKPGGRSA
jgi:hypothetical protein